ncbi:hypothetical protein N7468_007171 [Penicillium chermesinum]|uniref:Fermentation associated protein n=1 Tax=Penicillium chermesinum TaxID=63820 RepID=A0A9W9NTK5_9EURO|nr:uncharacterized protein N7468_007171 [Penicillium chermesinum]KAJ5225946.1 hypothetical protein N7468_007171 [Penicillium chermesinum]
MASTSLTASYLTPDPSFNWFVELQMLLKGPIAKDYRFFLLELIVCIILVLFFLLYFNRLFATLLSYGIRAYTWHYYRVYVDINALQISLLGGRIFFKGIRYHGANETIFIHGGFITWRYWKRKVQRTDLSRNWSKTKERSGEESRTKSDSFGEREQGGVSKTIELPCRISVKVYGLEWFIYNRTPAYDSILAGFGYKKDSGGEDGSIFGQDDPSKSKEQAGNMYEAASASGAKTSLDNRSDRSSKNPDFNYRDTEVRESELAPAASSILELLPLKIECSKGAIVMGNENTHSVMTTTFSAASGTIAAASAGPFDIYRQLFSFKINHPVVQLRPNPDFKQNQLAIANLLSTAKEELSESDQKRESSFNPRVRRRKMWHSLRDLIPYFQTSVESFYISSKQSESMPRSQAEFPESVHWTGLSRYLDEDQGNDHEMWSSVEYARFSTILDSESLEVTYFWDSPGRVEPEHLISQEADGDINHTPPPAYGVDLKVDGGMLNYGPWADRERVGLQNIFFPNFYRSSEPAEPLSPGGLRQSTKFKLRVEIGKELFLRIPTREPSKDWQWKGRADAIRGKPKTKQAPNGKSRPKEGDKGHLGSDIRPFGWLTLRVAADSTINYTMDMTASNNGFRNELTLDLRDSKMTSSVNHGVLWNCPRQLVTCDLSNPLTWNHLRSWKFHVECHDMELFLLRDHIFLITDLVSDWGSGPPSDYYTFVPFIYTLDLTFSNIQLFVNVNDRNIISNPSDLEDNRFIVIKSKQLASNVTICLDKYQPDQNTVKFKVNLQDGGVDFLTPVWDTFHTFLPDKSLATLDGLVIDGSYDYFLSTSPDLTDTLLLKIDGASPRLFLYGFLIKSFMTVRENYFGEEMHFKTLEEYQGLVHAEESPKNPSGINPNRKSNDMDVLVHVAVDSACALLPETIYDHLTCSRLSAASLDIDLRFTNYYMDMQLSLGPIKLDLQSTQSDGSSSVSETQLFIDGVSVYGHRVFGLPPDEPTYICNWDFDVGRVLGECSTEFLACLAAGAKSFDFSFDNEENTLHPLSPPVLHDVTFVRARVNSIHLAVLLEDVALILSSQPLNANFNDWESFQFSKRVSLLLPDLTIAAVDRQMAAKALCSPEKIVSPLGIIKMTVGFKMALRRHDIAESRRLQQEHIRKHDRRTHRAQWLLFDWEEEFDPIASIPHDADLVPPTMAIPSMPEPINLKTRSVRSPSYRGFPDTQPAGRPSGFRIPSETSSMKSAGSRAFRVPPISRSISEPQERPPPPDRDASWTTFQPGRGRDSESLGYFNFKSAPYSAAAIRDANPWSPPQFSYYKLCLDTSEIQSSESSHNPRQEDEPNRNRRSMFLSFEDDQTAHTNFALDVPQGIKGFCTPRFLLCLASLLDGLEPKHPVQIIDSLQKDVISDIVGYEKSMSQQAKIATAVALRIPTIQLRLVDISDSPNSKHVEFQDEYRIEVHRLRTEFQRRLQRQKGDLLEGIKQGITVHAAADHLSVSVQGSRTDAFQEKATFTWDLGDVNFWLATVPNVRSHLQMRTFDTVTSAKSVERLAFLVRRATTMFDSVASSFQQVSAVSKRRLRFLVYFTTKYAAQIPDPIFLTRISYVLRLISKHLRQHDSWKIISRIRNIYKCLPVHHRHELESTCAGDCLSLPSNAQSIVLTGFDQWRAWDLAHVEKSYVMRRIWPSPPQRKTSQSSVAFSCNIKTLRFSLDPGPRESDFIVEDVYTAFAVRPNNTVLENDKMKLKRLIMLQAFCSSADLRLRWEIADLVEGIMKVMSNVTLKSTNAQPAPPPEGREPSEIHITFGSDFGSITLDCINLQIALSSRGLRGSIVNQSAGGKNAKMQELALLFSAEAGSLALSGQSRVLMFTKIANPYLYLSLVSQEDEIQSQQDWRMAGSCRKLRYDMKEDPVSLAHTMDRVIDDEVRFIQQLINNVKRSETEVAAQETEKLPASIKSSHNSVNVAMFLDDYRLSFGLLPSLTYVVSGDVARMSVMPAANSQIEVDFDVKKNLHKFISGEGNKSRALSIMELPPTNGRILASLSGIHKQLEVDMTVETIRLEASAVRSLLSVLTGPDVSHLLSDLKQNLDVLKSHLSDVVSLPKVQPKEKPVSEDSVILYKSRLTMVGFEIHAIAPSASKKHHAAEMLFSLGMMQMRLENKGDGGYPMDYPEFSIDASQIKCELMRQEDGRRKSYGGFSLGVKLQGTSSARENGEVIRAYHLTSDKFDIELFAETAALVVDIAIYTQERIKNLDLSHEVKRLRRLRHRNHIEHPGPEMPKIQIESEDNATAETFLNAMYSLEFRAIQVAWNMASPLSSGSNRQPEDLVFSIQQVELSNKKKNSARLRIADMQLQMVPFHADRKKRSLNSALMPEVVFNVAYYSSGTELRLAFQAAGKALDIRATSEFIIPGNMVRNSIASAIEDLREGKIAWATKSSPDPESSTKDPSLFGNRKICSVYVDVDFAGATVSLQGKQGHDPQTLMTATLQATLRAPGVAFKIHYDDKGSDDPALHAELRVEPSTNVLYPTLVPLVKQMTATVKEIMGEQQYNRSRRPSAAARLQPQLLMQETPFGEPDPTSILGRCKVNIGLLFSKQEFTLSCQPIARVAATTRFESVYVTVNTVQSNEGRFLALSLAFNSLEASVKHVYSNESTASFEVRSMVLSLMNSKHLGRTSGISAILRVSPMKVLLNAKQLQDSLLFREIWLPSDDEPPASSPPLKPGPPEPQQPEAQSYIVQRYQQVSSASAAQFAIDNLWVSTNKTSHNEQSMCINFDSIGIESKGRLSGVVELRPLKVRTSIKWPEARESGNTPLIQASISFHHLQAKVSFDYQPFLVTHIAMFDFLMYNVREPSGEQSQRLFSILEGDEVHVFCTSLTASQALALYQAWQRLVQDKQSAYEASVREIERYLRRKSTVPSDRKESQPKESAEKEEDFEKAPGTLQTSVVVKIQHVNLGAFPSSFFDNQILKLDAHDAEARFGVSLESNKIHSALGLTLGQLRVALSGVNRPSSGQLEELSIDDLVQRASGSRGGTILKVPRLVAGMETWQMPGTRQIDYIFHSTFEGKVDVGWNYSRISFIRDMWETHSRALATRLGKPLPPSAVRITGGPGISNGCGAGSQGGGAGSDQQEKITAVVNVPQSKYSYTALEPPVIETPQLRDMGEATPPLEWIGLQRDKLPNVTHQIIIVTLLEIAKEVEDAYGKILGT